MVSDDTVPAVSARTRKPLIVEYVHLDDKFKDGVGDGSYKECHALCVPIFLESGHAYCVVEFVRLNLAKHFDQFSYNLSTGILSWIMACLQKMKKNRVRIRIRNTLLQMRRSVTLVEQLILRLNDRTSTFHSHSRWIMVVRPSKN